MNAPSVQSCEVATFLLRVCLTSISDENRDGGRAQPYARLCSGHEILADSVSLIPAHIVCQGGKCRRRQCDPITRSIPAQNPARTSQKFRAGDPLLPAASVILLPEPLASPHIQEKQAHSWNLLRIARGICFVNAGEGHSRGFYGLSPHFKINFRAAKRLFRRSGL
jgi:hypothetical protein